MQDGDWITLDCEQGRLVLEVDDATLTARTPTLQPRTEGLLPHGRQLFALFREQASPAEQGASPLLAAYDRPSSFS